MAAYMLSWMVTKYVQFVYNLFIVVLSLQHVLYKNSKVRLLVI